MEKMKHMDITQNSSLPFGVDVLASITQAQYIFFLEIYTPMAMSIAVAGIALNLINIRTFSVLGINDGVTMNFFALSVCDLIYSCVYLFLLVFGTFLILETTGVVWFRTHPLVQQAITSFCVKICSTISTLNVTFLAVARCVCVSLPFQFKNVFTPQVCLGFFISSVVFSFGANVPVASQIGVQMRFDMAKNATRLFLSLGTYFNKFSSGTTLFFDLIIPFSSLAIIITCIFIMTYKLRESAKFRNSQGGEQAKGKETAAKLSSRDLNVLRQVHLISVIFTVVSTPRVLMFVYRLIEPEFLVKRQYHFFYSMAVDVRLTFEAINAAANFFVYFRFNSAFRSACFSSKSRGKSMAR